MDIPNITKGNLSITNLSSTLTLRIKKNVFLIMFSVDNTKKKI